MEKQEVNLERWADAVARLVHDTPLKTMDRNYFMEGLDKVMKIVDAASNAKNSED